MRETQNQKEKEVQSSIILNYDAQVPVYGLNFSSKKIQIQSEEGVRESVLIGLTSCQQPHNQVYLLEMNEYTMSIDKLCEADEFYPSTKV